MEYCDIFTSCRNGDLERVRYLVEKRDVELNVRDKWDTTPLYYACLCGHEALVKYLLDNGARCQKNTFDGERCLYAALNDKIKQILKNYKMITSNTMRRDLYDELLHGLLLDDNYYDMQFKVGGGSMSAHRCIIAVRCPALHTRMQKRFEEGLAISMSQKINITAFRLVLSYIYTGTVQVKLEDVPLVALLAKQCGLNHLVQTLEEKHREIASFECSKIGVHVQVISVDSEVEKELLVNDFTLLADEAIGANMQHNLRLPFPPRAVPSYPDIAFIVDGERFLCHKAFFGGRSDYFKALFEDHFNENQQATEGMTVHLHNLSVNLFRSIIYYVYTDSCELQAETVHDMLLKADMYLLAGLKRQCANFIGKLIDTDNVCILHQTSRMFDLPKLEDLCAEFIANHLAEVIDQEEFTKCIMADAESVQQREESDSIDIVDNVRYHVACHVQTYSEIEEANSKLLLIDTLLEKLGLDC